MAVSWTVVAAEMAPMHEANPSEQSLQFPQSAHILATE